MKRKFILPALLALAVSCTTVEPVSPVRIPLSFRAGVGGFESKAGDTAFEAGDSVALWASGGVNAEMLPLVCEGESFSSPEELFWTDNNDADASFSAIYPFSAASSLSDGVLKFTVNADQSTHALYSASDLMTASCDAAFGTAVVSLPFRHVLTKYVVAIENTLDDPVAAVYLGGVLGSADVVPSWLAPSAVSTASATGSRGTVKASPVTLSDGKSAWVAVLPPQELSLTLCVVTRSGVQYKYETGLFRVDEGGVKINMELALTPLSLSSEIDPVVSGWTSDNDMNFHNE